MPSDYRRRSQRGEREATTGERRRERMFASSFAAPRMIACSAHLTDWIDLPRPSLEVTSAKPNVRTRLPLAARRLNRAPVRTCPPHAASRSPLAALKHPRFFGGQLAQEAERRFEHLVDGDPGHA